VHGDRAVEHRLGGAGRQRSIGVLTALGNAQVSPEDRAAAA
jgi:hypothetical protein